MRNTILAMGVVALGTAVSASAATISSGSFSIGYGITETTNTWDTTETAGVNVNVTGDFSLALNVVGSLASNAGPLFIDRVLTSSGGSRSGYSPDFGVTATAAYTGTPVDAAATPNYQITLNVTSIRIYANGYNTSNPTDGTSVYFTETTPGNAQSQSPVAVGPYAAANLAGSYTDINWNPVDIYSAGTNQIRNFGFLVNGGDGFLDGFEIFGDIVVTYDAVPEPASLGLIGVGALLMGRRRRM